jgi:uncharacterized protein DUF6967
MDSDEKHLLETFELPFGQRIDFFEMVFEDDVRLIQVRIKEKSRFTIFNLDPDTAQAMGDRLRDWAVSRQNESDIGSTTP